MRIVVLVEPEDRWARVVGLREVERVDLEERVEDGVRGSRSTNLARAVRLMFSSKVSQPPPPIELPGSLKSSNTANPLWSRWHERCHLASVSVHQPASVNR